MLITRQDKEKLVIKLAEEGKTTRDIAKEVYISLKDISKIIRKAAGDSESQVEKDKRILSPYARAFKMFKVRKPLAGVSIELDIKTDLIKFSCRL